MAADTKAFASPVFDQMLLTWFSNVVKLVAGLVPLELCAGVTGAHHSKVASLFGLKSPLVQMWALSNHPFIIFGMASKNNMGSLQLCNAVSQFWELPLK